MVFVKMPIRWRGSLQVKMKLLFPGFDVVSFGVGGKGKIKKLMKQFNVISSLKLMWSFYMNHLDDIS